MTGRVTGPTTERDAVTTGQYALPPPGEGKTLRGEGPPRGVTLKTRRMHVHRTTTACHDDRRQKN
jgi:hypothetical protein